MRVIASALLVLSTLVSNHAVHAADLSDSPMIRDIRARAEFTLDTLTTNWVDRGGIEIVTGGPSAARTESRWGHVSLRFVGSAEYPLEDLTIEAMAINAPGDSLAKLMFNGAFGGYAIAPLVQTLGQLIRGYYFQETRGYTRTIIPSDAPSRRALIDTLRGINRVNTGRDRYYFLTVNCTSYMSWILSQAGFRQLDMPVPFIPTQASLHLRRSFLSPWPELTGIAVTRLLTEVAFVPGEVDHLSTLDLQRLIAFRGFKLGDTYGAALTTLAARTDLRTTDEVYGVKSLPAVFYQSDAAELARVPMSQIRAAFTRRQLERTSRANRAAWTANYTTSFCRDAAEQCRYFERAQALIRSAAP